jgi:hypothetical protein
MQNPGQDHPVQAPQGSLPLLIGVWDEEGTPVLVGYDARRRVGQPTRQSLFVKLQQLRQAAALGWAEGVNALGEPLFAFRPALLAAYVEMLRTGVSLTESHVLASVSLTGIDDNAEGETAEARERRVTTALIRSAVFSRRVLDAYDGQCALCGLNSGLVQAAHVYPVGAPGSRDETWNGIALCCNHHAAFDRHLLWVDPRSYAVTAHPEFLPTTQRSVAARHFTEDMFPQLRVPRGAARPREEMFQRRYEFYAGRYDWTADTVC